MTNGIERTGHVAITTRIADHGGIAAECRALTGGAPDADGIAPCASTSRIPRAAYVRVGVEVLATASTFDELRERVAALAERGLDATRFRIDLHDPSRRSTRSTVETATALADVLLDLPDLSTPLHRLVVAVASDTWTFGEVVAESDGSYRRHDEKPWTTSSSLDSRFARSLVNLVPEARSILDPCCGAGSIVIEAASLGLDAFGVDWKPAMVGMTRENLAHLGYDATVVRADSRDHEQSADAIVTDLPYGNAIDQDERSIRGVLDRSSHQAPVGVFVAQADISSWLDAAGYTGIELHRVLKRRGLTRWIHVARSTHAGPR